MRRISLLLLSGLLGGCGTLADPTEWLSSADVVEPSELVDFEARLDPRTVWSRDTGAGTDQRRLNLRPTVVDDTLYVADGEGHVEAIDTANGRVRWEADTDSPVAGGPGVGGDLVVLGTSEAEVIALAADSGAERWRVRVSSEVLSVPAVAGGVVIVHTTDGKLFGLEATNGNERWRYERQVPVLTLRGVSSPVLDGPVAYVGVAGGKLLALRADNGNLVWETTITVPGGRSELQRLADIDGDPLVLGGGVFVATYQGEVAAVQQSDGRVAWRRKMSVYGGMAADGRSIYVGDANGIVWGLDLRTGNARWSQDSLKYRRLSSVATVEGLVVVGDFEGYLHWLDAADGSFVARTRVGSDPITSGLTVDGGVLYVLGDGGELDAVSVPARP